MRGFIIILLLMVCAAVLTSSQLACAGGPTEGLQQSVDSVLAIARNEALKGPGKQTERRAAMRKIVDNIFDFGEMSKRSMALNWKKRTPEEKKEFVSLFADLLEATYASKIERYNGEKIVYTGESIDDGYSMVRTKVITKTNTEIPLDYKLMREGGKWMVYDVVIEGVSLINNYRSQFNQIISSGSYDGLVARLKKKSIEEPK